VKILDICNNFGCVIIKLEHRQVTEERPKEYAEMIANDVPGNPTPHTAVWDLKVVVKTLSFEMISRSSSESEDDRRIRKVDETSAVWPAAIVTTMFPEVTPSNNEIELGKASMDLQASAVINEDFTEISHLPMSRRSFSLWRDYQAGFECTDFIKDRKVSQTRKCTSLEEREVWNVKRDNGLQYLVNKMGRASRDKRDIYYIRAKEEGWSARSAFKLLQIDEGFSIFEGVKRVADLCAAPGSWSQPMAPIKGVIQVQGDITNARTAEVVIKHFDGCEVDLVACNGAPDIIGLHDMNEFVQSQLILAGFNPKDLHHLLEKVGTPSGADDLDCSSSWLEGPNMVYIPFLACEDLSGFDSGRSYPLPTVAEGCSYQSLDPVQPPISFPHNRAREMKKASNGTGSSLLILDYYFFSQFVYKELIETKKPLKRFKDYELKNKECDDAWLSLWELQNELMRKSMHVGSLAYAKEGQMKEKSRWLSSLRDLPNKFKMLKMEHTRLSAEALEYKKCIKDVTKMTSTIQSANIRVMNGEAVYARPKKMGMIILGGGQPKHHIYNANMFCNDVDYAIFINTVQEFDGSDSGACPNEAVPWGKIRGSAETVEGFIPMEMLMVYK
ncbi:hypothetical protein GIB67_010747, partial [Kingdonia uniflora]